MEKEQSKNLNNKGVLVTLIVILLALGIRGIVKYAIEQQATPPFASDCPSLFPKTAFDSGLIKPDHAKAYAAEAKLRQSTADIEIKSHAYGTANIFTKETLGGQIRVALKERSDDMIDILHNDGDRGAVL